MLTRTMRGPLREVWVEANPADFDGGSDFWVKTDISPVNHSRGKPDLDYVEVYLYVDGVVGSPVIPDPEVRWAWPNKRSPTGTTAGYLEVRVQNTAPAGNQAAYTLDIRLNHTVVR